MTGKGNILLLYFEKTESTVKNRKNERNDTSFRVDHLGDGHGSRSGASPPIREAVLPRSLSLRGLVGGDRGVHFTCRQNPVFSPEGQDYLLSF